MMMPVTFTRRFALRRVSGQLFARGMTNAFRYSDKVLKRIQLDPGLPAANPTQAIWQNPPHRLAHVRSPKLPQIADVVLIGSGITSCSIARTILLSPTARRERPRVVVLEARTLSSGASGRNGGHLRDAPFIYFSYLKEQFGAQAAKKMCKFRSSHVQEILRLIKEEGLVGAAELKGVEAVDVAIEAEKWEELKQGIDDYVENVPADERFPFEIWDQEEARNRFNIPKAFGAISYKAWTHSTYQLVAGVFANLVNNYPNSFSIETETPALSIGTADTSSGPYKFKVITPRGSINCRHIVHCTNSHAAHLLPGLRGKIIPVRDEMTEQVFDVNQKDGVMDRSWIFFWNKGVDYMVFRQGDEHRTGGLLLGGGLSHASDDGLDSVGEPRDDDQTIPVKAYLSGLLPSLFAGSKNTDILSTWTGILGWSADLMPWVGPIPSSVSGRDIIRENGNQKQTDAAWAQVDGREWISAGYSGEGMTLAWKCGKAVAYMILGLDKQYKVQDWLPEQYLITAKRAKDADVRKQKELY